MALHFRSPLLLIIILSILFTFSLFNVSTASSNRKMATMIDGFHPLDPQDPKVVDVGNFAVHEYNKQSKSKLKFKNVFKAAGLDVAGTKSEYALIIGAKEHHVFNKYGSVVLEEKNSTRVLVAFRMMEGL